MIVRRYGRRKMGRTLSETSLEIEEQQDEEEEDPFTFRETTTTTTSTSTSYSLSLSQFQESPQEIGNFTFSSQDSTRWVNSDTENNNNNNNNNNSSLQLLSRGREKARRLNDGRRESKKEVSTTTLMETQEYGEMMECVDEVEFALDGLRGGQGIRVRRASLLSLLNVCGSSQQRRLLKAQGMARTIIDAILDLSLDDPPSNLAAATLFYILTSDTRVGVEMFISMKGLRTLMDSQLLDAIKVEGQVAENFHFLGFQHDQGQDSYLLDSSPSIRFLLKLLKPIVAERGPEKAPSISQKLLALRKDMIHTQGMKTRVDSNSTTIIQKVMETLVSCKDLKACNVENDDYSRTELNPNWISLLTMEKACMSTIFEDTCGTVRKTGGNFKEKLRELGGLDTVFELAMKFHSTLEGSIEYVPASIKKLKDSGLQCLPLLLKCLKIMENATFLSKENQSHLLGLKGNLAAGQGSSLSFVKLMISFIKILSELLLRTSSVNSSPQMPTNRSNGSDRYPELFVSSEQKVDSYGVSSRSSQECSSSGRCSSDTGLSKSQSSQWLPSLKSGSLSSKSGATTTFGVGNCLIEKAASSLGFGSCSFNSRSSNVGAPTNGLSSKTKLATAKSPYDDDDDVMFIDLEDSQDPFAFDEEDFAPCKWEALSGRQTGRRKQKRPALRDAEDECLSLPMLSQEDCSSQPMLSQEEFGNNKQDEGINISSDTSCTTAIDEENSSLVFDCLLTAIKVLMNLTNDNAVGCQQIAACGGLETLSSLIARHFPSFSLFNSGERKENTIFTGTDLQLQSQTDIHLNDQELDFLVTILGLLVNMVENNGDNRSRLATAEVSLHCSRRLHEVHTGVIPLLCSIFLVNRGAGEAAEEELQSWDAEEVVLQGEKEAEKMIVEAYAALLLAFLSTESKSIRNMIANNLPDRSLKVLVPVLERFVTFHMTLNMISPETHKTVSEVIESCRIP